MLVVKGAVIKLNVLNTKCGSKLNETDQREQLSELIIISSELYVKKYMNGIIVFENETYVIKNKEMIGLRRKLKQINIDNYKTTIIRGKRALDKYGFIGIYGVIEITKK